MDFISAPSCGSLTRGHNINAAHGMMQPAIRRIMQAINIQKGTYAKFHKLAPAKRIKHSSFWGFYVFSNTFFFSVYSFFSKN